MKVSIFSSFEDLPEYCQTLFQEAEKESLFFGYAWFAVFNQYVALKNYSVTIFVLETDSRSETTGKCEAIFIMQSPKNEPDKLEGMSNYYSSLYGPIVSKDCNFDQVVDAFCKKLVDMKPAYYQINMNPLDTDTENFESTIKSLRKHGFWVQKYFCFGNWFLKLNGRSFKEYFQSLPSKTRNTVTRKKKKLEKMHDVQIKIFTSPDDVEYGMTSYEKIYSASWKNDEPYKDFIRALAKKYAEKGELRLGLITVDNNPAASQIWFVSNSQAYIFKLAYDEKYNKLSVGSVLTTTLFEYVIDNDKVEIIDYLTGDDAYKKDWMSDRRERWGIAAFNPRTLKGFMLGVRHIGLSKLKSMFRS